MKHTREIRIVGSLAYVPLTRGYEATIDASDAHLIDGVNWHALVSRRTVYGARTDLSTGAPRGVLLHRIIMGEPAGLEIDHIDGNGLNNARENLRVATAAQNKQNRKMQKNNASGLKGASWHKGDKKWQAVISFNGKSRYLGMFETKEDAHGAYCKASADLHGEFGNVG